MQLIDSHSHLFLPEFDNDRNEVIQRAKQMQLSKIILPNIDSSTLQPLMSCCRNYPDLCTPLIGLHPGSVNENFENELDCIIKAIEEYHPAGIGEIGLDFYWDTTFKDEQMICFKTQLEWAKQMKLPVAVHVRNSHQEVMTILRKVWTKELRGVFHCFTGGHQEAEEINELGFYFGIGGIVTFKNSGLSEVVRHLPLEKIIIETDSPYLAPVPYRGKRNESSYLPVIAEYLSALFKMGKEEFVKILFDNTVDLFSL